MSISVARQLIQIIADSPELEGESHAGAGLLHVHDVASDGHTSNVFTEPQTGPVRAIADRDTLLIGQPDDEAARAVCGVGARSWHGASAKKTHARRRRDATGTQGSLAEKAFVRTHNNGVIVRTKAHLASTPAHDHRICNHGASLAELLRHFHCFSFEATHRASLQTGAHTRAWGETRKASQLLRLAKECDRKRNRPVFRTDLLKWIRDDNYELDAGDRRLLGLLGAVALH